MPIPSSTALEEMGRENLLVLLVPLSFFPLKPHLLPMLRLMGFFSFFSVGLLSLIFCTAAIFASISFFFLRMSSACSVIATSLLGFPSPGLGLPLGHIFGI